MQTTVTTSVGVGVNVIVGSWEVIPFPGYTGGIFLMFI